MQLGPWDLRPMLVKSGTSSQSTSVITSRKIISNDWVQVQLSTSDRRCFERSKILFVQ